MDVSDGTTILTTAIGDLGAQYAIVIPVALALSVGLAFTLALVSKGRKAAQK